MLRKANASEWWGWPQWGPRCPRPAGDALDAEDLSAPTVVEEHVEYFNDFAIGFYDFGREFVEHLPADGIQAVGPV